MAPGNLDIKIAEVDSDSESSPISNQRMKTNKKKDSSVSVRLQTQRMGPNIALCARSQKMPKRLNSTATFSSNGSVARKSIMKNAFGNYKGMRTPAETRLSEMRRDESETYSAIGEEVRAEFEAKLLIMQKRSERAHGIELKKVQ